MSTSGAWTSHRAPDGREYWYNTATRQSTYEKPDELKSIAEKAVGGTVWKEYVNQGRKYYFNVVTKESKWEAPQEYKEWLEKIIKVRAEEAKQSPQPGTMHFRPAAGAGQPVQAGIPVVGQQMVLGAASPQAMGIAPAATMPPAAPTIREFHSRMEADAAFRELLQKREVGPDWTWEQTMRELVTDPTYKGLRNWIDKRAVWEHFVGEIKERREEERKKRVEKLVQGIGEMMRKSTKTRPYMSYYTAGQVFKGQPVWESAKSEAERLEAFDEIIVELKKAEADREMKVRKETMDGFAELLKACDIDVMTSWQQALKRVQSLPDFAEDEVMRNADLLDLLMIFEEMMRGLEREQAEATQREKDERRRQSRKAREGFSELLTELKEAGILNAYSQWEEIVPLLNEEDRFHAILGQPGSTALELFWDVREGLKSELEKHVAEIESYLRTQGAQIDRTTTFPEYQGHLMGSPFTFDESRLEEIYTYHQVKLNQRTAEEIKEEERQRRHRIEDLRYRLKKLVPDLEIDLDLDLDPESVDSLADRSRESEPKLSEVDKVILSLWREVEPKLVETDEYRALSTSPEDLLLAFIKFCRRQQEKAKDRLRESKRQERERHRSRRLSEERKMTATQASSTLAPAGGRGGHGGDMSHYLADSHRPYHHPPRARASDVLQYD